MQRIIIVQQESIRSNGEGLTYLIRDNPITPPIWKLQQLELGNSDLGETNFVVNRTIRATPQE
jgi:hypothetical protein